MENQNYQNSIYIKSTPQQVFDVITNRISGWWSEDFQGVASKVNDEFTVRFGPTFKTMRITSIIQDEYIEWLCIDQHIEMPEGMKPINNPREWVGNKIEWQITSDGSITTLHHTHIGLTPEEECWTVCEPGWNQTLKSVQQLLITGKGNPFVRLDDEHMERARKISQQKSSFSL